MNLLLDDGTTATYKIERIVPVREDITVKDTWGGCDLDGGYGYTDALVTFSSNNLRFCKNMTFRIPNKQGSIPGLSTITLPHSLVSIKDEAFADAGAECIILPRGCTSIGSRAFADCDHLVEIVIPRTMTDIAEDAFTGISPVLVVKAGSYAERIAKSRGWRYTRG